MATSRDERFSRPLALAGSCGDRAPPLRKTCLVKRAAACRALRMRTAYNWPVPRLSPGAMRPSSGSGRAGRPLPGSHGRFRITDASDARRAPSSAKFWLSSGQLMPVTNRRTNRRLQARPEAQSNRPAGRRHQSATGMGSRRNSSSVMHCRPRGWTVTAGQRLRVRHRAASSIALYESAASSCPRSSCALNSSATYAAEKTDRHNTRKGKQWGSSIARQ